MATLPQLLYAQVVKSYRRRRITGVKHRVVCGTAETIESILAKRGWKIITAFIERLHLDFRQHVAAIGRRINRQLHMTQDFLDDTDLGNGRDDP